MKNLLKSCTYTCTWIFQNVVSISFLLLLFSHTGRRMNITSRALVQSTLYIQLFDFHFISNLRFTLTLTKLKELLSVWRFFLRPIFDFSFFLFIFTESGLNALNRLLCTALWIYFSKEKKNKGCTPFAFSISFIYGLLRSLFFLILL